MNSCAQVPFFPENRTCRIAHASSGHSPKPYASSGPTHDSRIRAETRAMLTSGGADGWRCVTIGLAAGTDPCAGAHAKESRGIQEPSHCRGPVGRRGPPSE